MQGGPKFIFCTVLTKSKYDTGSFLCEYVSTQQKYKKFFKKFS